MARAKSVVLSKAEKKAIVADLKAKLKAAKEGIKADEAVLKAAAKVVADGEAMIAAAAAVKQTLKDAKTDVKEVTKRLAGQNKAVEALTKQLDAVTAG